jgi:outer membrane lipoprotein SlyB
MGTRAFTRGLLFLSLLTCAACASRRPVLYPNEHWKQVGAAAADRDVDDCMRLADQFVSSGGRSAQTGKTVATSTAVGAGSGAAIGAVGGAITGSAGEGAAIGAATGGTAGLLSGIFGASHGSGPDPVYANFVDRCLRDRGYDPIGWQ